MNTIWQTLGLDGPTDDLKVIKRAYAAKLKTTRPEDDAAGFMALREALEMAKNHARYAHFDYDEDDAGIGSELAGSEAAEPPQNGNLQTPAPDDAPIFIVAGQEAGADDTSQNSEIHKEAQEQSDPPPLSPAARLIEKMHILIGHPFQRGDKAAWAQIFDDPGIEPLEDWIEFDHRLRDYFLTVFGGYDGKTLNHNRNRKPKIISSKIGTYIFDRMDWHDYQGHPCIAEELAWLKTDLDVMAPRGMAATPPPEIIRETGEDEGTPWGKIFWGLIIASALIQLVSNLAGG